MSSVEVSDPKCTRNANARAVLTLPDLNQTTSTFDKMVNEASIQAALAEAHSETSLNLSAIAKKYNIVPSTLNRRFHRTTSSRADVTSNFHRHMSDVEEASLVDYMKRTALFGLYLTPRMLRTIVEGRVGHEISDKWAWKFVKRHEDELKGIYLSGLDKARNHAQNPDDIQCFFHNVVIGVFWNASTDHLIAKRPNLEAPHPSG